MGLRLAPRSIPLYGNRATAYYCLGKYAEALEDYNTIIGLAPQ